MKNQFLPCLLTLLLLQTAVHADLITFGSGANQFNMQFVPIGNPGNVADTTGNPNPAGSVGYHYNMGKYEVSRDMVNKANAAGNLGITLDPMAFVTGGVRPEMAAAGFSWNEAARFVNWLNISKGFAPAYKFELQPGEIGYDSNANIQLWQSGDAGFNAANPFRNTQARYFLPSVDEWYKAAYYDPNANGGAGGYWKFSNGSNLAPTAVSGGTLPNTAVYAQALAQGPADIDDAGGLSPYGLMGMGGNVWEFEETSFDMTNSSGSALRTFRGGNWVGNVFLLSASDRYDRSPSLRSDSIGFRVASIPEPSSAVLVTLAAMGFAHRRRRIS